MSEEILDLFRQTNALLEGHFVLRSGLHSRQFFQCALLLQYPVIAAQVCGQLAERMRHMDADTVISPAIGGLFVGHEIGRQLSKKHIFVEKENNVLVLRRGFTITPGERFLVLEDVVTKGGRVAETIAIVQQHGGVVAAVGTLVDRSGDQTPDFGCPFLSLLKLHVETWPADQLPADLAAMPLTRPGSK